MVHPRHWSLATKLPLTLAMVVVTVSLTIGLAMVAQERGRIRADLQQQAMRAAYSVAANAADATLRADYWGLYKILDQMAGGDMGGRPLLMGVILDRNGVVMAALDPSSHPVGLHLASADPVERTRIRHLITARGPSQRWSGQGGEAFIEAVYPIEANHNFTGLVLLRLSAAEVASRTWTASIIIFSIAAALAFVGSAIGAYISNRMIQPLRELSAAMATMARGDPLTAPRVRINDYDEIGRLVEAFEGMAKGLEEKRALERELATTEKLAALGGIAAGVAHEINNPLAGMLNCIDTIDRYPENRFLVNRYLPLIKGGLHRIHSIVRGLLAELRIDEDVQWRDGACLDDIRGLILAETGERDIELLWTNDLGCHTHLQCGRIQQVVFNLLRNAVQAVPAGGRVAFRAFEDGDGVVFEVEDDGVGIPPESLTRLFEPFFTSKPNGTGLGLWITYRLIQGMGGSIEVQSEPGLGSLFRIRIPQRHDMGMEDRDAARGVGNE